MKFTKGDIVVNLEKLDFFQRKHGRLLLNDERPDVAVINEYLVDPALQRIREVEAQRREGSTENGTFSHLGPLVPGLQNLDEEAARLYIHNALRISRADAITPEDVVRANEFLIWQPSTEQISNSCVEMGELASAIRIEETPASPADVAAYFLQGFEKLGPDDWTAKNIESALADSVHKVQHYGEGENKGDAGYHLLRWALLSSRSGPQMAPLMELLGRQETLRRLSAAKAIADGTGGGQGQEHTENEAAETQ